MKKTYRIVALAFASVAFGVHAQDGLPTDPEPGKCYAKCVEPDEYKEEIIKVLSKPAYTKLEVVPAEYKTVTETVVVKPESKKFILEKAEYKTVYDTIWIEDPYNKLSVVPEEFSDDFETVEIKAATTRWVAGEKDPDCPSINPEDCRILHYIEVPEVTRDVPVKKKVKDQTTTSKRINGKYEVVAREVTVKEPTYRTEVIPAVTKEITKKVLEKDETTRTVEVPAEYTEVIKRTLVKQGGLTVWKEVPCTIPEQGIILPITYASGSSALTATAKRIIDNNLLDKLKADPGALVEIGSHTDAQGSSSSNQSLSERRAKEVVEYLISKGISKERLLAVGYGESKPINECVDGVECSSAKLAANRRTEFKLF